MSVISIFAIVFEKELNALMYKVGIISYTNVLPFLYGLRFLQNIELVDIYPSMLSEYFFDGQMEVALLPIGKLIGRGDVEIISDYCIGSVGKVDSVCLFSNVKKEYLNKIVLDYQSETSVRLVQVLGKEYWKLNNVEYVRAKSRDYFNEVSDGTGVVVIGDRTFDLDKRFKYVYDLSEEWYMFTGLPFVFAVWVKRKDTILSESFLSDFNKALGKGMNKIQDVIKFFDIEKEKEDYIKFYLTKRISYVLDENKIKAIRLFSEYVKKLGL